MQLDTECAPFGATRAALSGFERDPERSYGDPRSASGVVVGENLGVMKRLVRAGFAGRFRCIYFDPPYNSGRRFAEYADALDPAAWRAMIRERLAVAAPLLAADGAIFVEIDDTELGTLQLEMDRAFGREHRVSTVTLVRSAPTGHKAINRGPVNVTDFVLVYAKDRAHWRCNPLVRERTRYDRAYSTWLDNPEDPLDRWRFESLAAHVRRAVGRRPSREEVEAYAVLNAARVVRFAQPRYEAVSAAARSLIDIAKHAHDPRKLPLMLSRIAIASSIHLRASLSRRFSIWPAGSGQPSDNPAPCRHRFSGLSSERHPRI